MARLFARASNQYGQYAGAVVSAPPITVSLWYYPTDTVANHAEELFSITDNSAANNDAIRLSCNYDNGAGRPLQITTRHAGVETDNTASALIPTLNAWNSVVGTIDAGMVQLVYLNGTVLATLGGAGLSTTTGLSKTNIGAYVSNNGANIVNPISGRLAEVTVWNVALTAAEALALSKGVRSGLVRPASIVGYWPLYGLASPEPDLSGRSQNMTLTSGPTATTGPPTALWTRNSPDGGTVTPPTATLYELLNW